MSFMTSSAASGVMSFLTKGVGSKLVFYVIIVWFVTGAMNMLAGYMPHLLQTDFLGSLPSYMWYFVAYFMMPQFLSAYIGMLVLKWILRKIPVIGN